MPLCFFLLMKMGNKNLSREAAVDVCSNSCGKQEDELIFKEPCWIFPFSSTKLKMHIWTNGLAMWVSHSRTHSAYCTNCKAGKRHFLSIYWLSPTIKETMLYVNRCETHQDFSFSDKTPFTVNSCRVRLAQCETFPVWINDIDNVASLAETYSKASRAFLHCSNLQ